MFLDLVTASAGDRPESLGVPSNVRFGSLTDVVSFTRHVRSSPQSGHSSARFARPLSAKSGHHVAFTARVPLNRKSSAP